MKQFILTFLFCATLGLGFSQPCNVHVTNTTGQDLAFGVQSTTNTLNVCPTGSFTSVGPIFIPSGAGTTTVLLGTVIPGDPPNQTVSSRLLLRFRTGNARNYQLAN